MVEMVWVTTMEVQAEMMTTIDVHKLIHINTLSEPFRVLFHCEWSQP